MAFSSIGDYFPQLAGLSADPPDPRPAALGGQSFEHCCRLAVNDSLAVAPDTGNLSYADPSFVDPGVSVEDLLVAAATQAFPCGAQFTGDKAGAPVVSVTYAWCRARCPGWETSRVAALRQWVGPLVQFIVPSLAFCTNVPRTRRVRIPDAAFRARPRTPAGLATYPARLAGALALALLDTVAWLAICFAFAGPMLLSAVYEYALDRKVLEFLALHYPVAAAGGEVAMPSLPMRLRAHLLLAVVCGNIRMAAPDDRARVDSGLGGGPEEEAGGAAVKTTTTPAELPHNSVWRRIVAMVDEYEVARTEGPAATARVVPLPVKLKSLLNSQASFGSTVGASVLFFVGGFIYTVIDSESSLGDNDTAHALAFGMWWMVIPYLAIIACAMLAANSPSTLRGIVHDGTDEAAPDRYEPSFFSARVLRRAESSSRSASRCYRRAALRRLEGYSLTETAFQGRFRPVKLWKRGLNKRQWVQEAVDDYAALLRRRRRRRRRGRGIGVGVGVGVAPDELRASLTLDARDCCYVAVGSLSLIVTPNALAFLLSYNTPRVGLSCRSLTYLVYAISQVCEMVLWSVAARLRIKYGTRWSEEAPIAKRVCWYGQVFVGFFAIFAAVGGTILQLLGVYRTCLCQVPATYWPYLNTPEAYFPLSTNSQAAIKAAEAWWTVTGSTAVGLMSIVTALAWWHQRRLHKVFRDEADKLEFDEIY